MAEEHPARAAGLRSQDAVTRNARAEWLDLFADDAVIQDPVGKSPLDPSGEGHRGKAAIGKFYDLVIADSKITFHFPKSFAAGDECAFVGSLTTVRAGISTTTVELVAVYKVNADGKLASLRAFWEFDKMLKQL